MPDSHRRVRSNGVLERGFEIIDHLIDEALLADLPQELTFFPPSRSGSIRNAEKKFAAIDTLASSPLVIEAATTYLRGEPRFVRAILFNKTANHNWLVGWHQDRTVAVSKKFNAPGWGPWAIKDDVHHAQPPLEVLNQVVTFRIHLDDADENNGCLKVIPGSHRTGILSQAKIDRYVENHEPFICTAKAGSVLVMRPHVLHASSKATSMGERRVIHLEYSSYRLRKGLSGVGNPMTHGNASRYDQ